MKIHFLEVSGQVGIDDKYSFQDARTGLTLETQGKPYIIVTGENSSAKLIIDAEPNVKHLGANTVLHVSWNKPLRYKSPGSLSVRIITGRVWAKIMDLVGNEENYEIDVSAVVGVRG